jgi:hypothetical protein
MAVTMASTSGVSYLLLEGLLLAARTALQSAGRLIDANLNHLLRFGIMRRIMAHAARLDLSSYEELIRSNAGYEELFEAQARWYR